MNKARAKEWILRSGALRAAGALQAPGVAVLMYHSVMDDPRAAADTLGGIVHSTAVFRAQMEELARTCHAASLEDAGRFARGEQRLPRRSVVVTFDDGYADNLEVAAPILNELGIPGAVYVTVGCVERRQLPWPARLRYGFRTSKRPAWRDAQGREFRLESATAREQAFDAASEECARLAGDAQAAYVTQQEAALEATPPEGELMMTWPQVRKMREQGHTIGSHTLTHPNIAYVSGEEARHELTESKRRLEQETGGEVAHFAYPGPALRPIWTDGSRQMSREAGYRTAVTTSSGLVRGGDDPLTLRRLGAATELGQWRWNLECTFAGRRM